MWGKKFSTLNGIAPITGIGICLGIGCVSLRILPRRHLEHGLGKKIEYLASSMRWLLHYSKKNHIPLPESDKIDQIIDRTLEIAEKLPRGMNETKKQSMSR